MRRGKNLLIDIGKTKPDFNSQLTNEQSFKADLVFDYAEWRKEQNHRRFVREDEKKADSENSEEGFQMNPMTSLAVVSTAEDERDISEQLQKIPNSGAFMRIIIIK